MAMVIHVPLSSMVLEHSIPQKGIAMLITLPLPRMVLEQLPSEKP